MSQSWVIFKNVSFTYETVGNPLLKGLSLHFASGWTGIVGANGAGKTTLLRLATAELEPQLGQVIISGQTAYCPQRTDDPPKTPPRFLVTRREKLEGFGGLLAIGEDWVVRWGTLSHDRELLDALCHQCIFVEPPHAAVRNGNCSEAIRQVRQEEVHRRRERKTAKTTYARLRRTVIRRREEAARSNQKRSKRGLLLKDHDGRGKKGPVARNGQRWPVRSSPESTL